MRTAAEKTATAQYHQISVPPPAVMGRITTAHDFRDLCCDWQGRTQEGDERCDRKLQHGHDPQVSGRGQVHIHSSAGHGASYHPPANSKESLYRPQRTVG